MAEKFDLGRIDDFRYYSRVLQIKTKDRRRVRFTEWWEAQEIFHHHWEARLKKNQPIRFIILKARQEGISTYTEGRIFQQVSTVANTNALILSHDVDSAGKIFEMSRGFYEGLPEAMRPMKRYSNKKELRFENPDEKTRLQDPGLQSFIEIQTAGKWEPSRGGMYHCVHFSEAAFYPDNATDLVAAIIPMVPMIPGTIIVYESTANGMNNDFYDDWEAAVNGESMFEPLFIPWFKLSDYALGFDDKKQEREWVKSLDAEERDIMRRYTLTPAQMRWRRAKIGEMRGDTDRFCQEFPATPEEAFIFHGTPIFPRSALKRQKAKNPRRSCDISIEKLSIYNDLDGLLDIWEEPEPGAEYVIGVDVASGEGEDFSCGEVLKRTWPNGLAEQVAEWHGKVDPVALAKLMVILARYYNEAMVSIELNNHGFTTQAEAKNFYWNFYRWQYLDRLGGNKLTDKIGWQTTLSTKPLLVDRMVATLDADLIIIRSQRLLDEMWKYIRVPGSMSFEAERGHDDRVMASMIALFTMYATQPGLDFDHMNIQPKKAISARIILPKEGDPIEGWPQADYQDPRGGSLGEVPFENM